MSVQGRCTVTAADTLKEKRVLENVTQMRVNDVLCLLSMSLSTTFLVLCIITGSVAVDVGKPIQVQVVSVACSDIV